MEQMELFEGLEPIQKYLHVWTEAQRARAIKKPRDEAQGEVPANRGEERIKDSITPLPRTRLGATHGE